MEMINECNVNDQWINVIEVINEYTGSDLWM